MTNPNLAADYKKRAKGRLEAIRVLFKHGLYADVVRESQEACELALKALIREAGHAVPMVHDVSQKLLEVKADLPTKVQTKLESLCNTSRDLRRDRELSFYGSEDITPSEFYRKEDAEKAVKQLEEVLSVVD